MIEPNPKPPTDGDGNKPKPPTKIARALAVVALLAAGAIVAIPASPAAASWDACPTGVACMYVDINGSGSMLIASVGAHGVNTCWNLNSSWNDIISSATSKFSASANIRLKLYVHAGCATPATTITPGERANFDWGSTFRDSVSSFALVSP